MSHLHSVHAAEHVHAVLVHDMRRQCESRVLAV